MDGFTLGTLLRTLLESAGIKGTAIILLVLGVPFLFFKLIRSAVGILQGLAVKATEIFQKLLESRDIERQAFLGQMTSLTERTMERVSEQDKSFMAYSNSMAKIMEGIANKLDMQTNELRQVRSEAQLNHAAILVQHAEMNEKLSEIKGMGLS